MLFDKLSSYEKKLLNKIIKKHQPHLLPLLNLPNNRLLSSEERENLREAIADELVESGLDKNDEPTQQGLVLEELIDRLWYLSEDGQ